MSGWAPCVCSICNRIIRNRRDLLELRIEVRRVVDQSRHVTRKVGWICGGCTYTADSQGFEAVITIPKNEHENQEQPTIGGTT